MFHIDATFEDTRFIAHSNDGVKYTITLCDTLTGATSTAEATQEEVGAMMDCAISHDGEGKNPKSHSIVIDWNVRNDIPSEMSMCP